MAFHSFPTVFFAAAFILAGAWAKSPEEFVGTDPKPAAAPAKPQAAAAPAAPAKVPAAAPAPAAKPAPASAPAPSPAASPAPAGKPAAAPAKTAAAKAAKPVLDTAHIHSIYLDGDFDQAIRLLDGALKGKRALTHADSVFIFKHLGVIYAATPSTREKGRYYMLQLISIEPTAKILDMYASDMIYLIFRNVQEEFENKYGRSIASAPAPDTVPASHPEPPKDSVPAKAPEKAGHGTAYWVAGGAAVAVGVAGLVYILLDNPEPKKHNIVLQE